MDLIFIYTLAIIITHSFVHAEKRDKRFCRLLIERVVENRRRCYNTAVYENCKDTCKQIVISKHYLKQDCPWGNLPNATRCREISYLTSGLYCRRIVMDKKVMDNPANENYIIGMNCCGKCMETKGTSPDRTDYFRDKYPGLFKEEHTFLQTLHLSG